MTSSKGIGRRVIVDNLRPEVDCGRFPIKRVVGEAVAVEVDLYLDGHDMLDGVLLHRHESETVWSEIPLTPLGNDRWTASFQVEKIGSHFYTVQGWVAPFSGWRRDLRKRIAAGHDVRVDLLVGAEMLRDTSQRARGDDRDRLTDAARRFEAMAGSLAVSNVPLDTTGALEPADTAALDLADAVSPLAARYPDREHASAYGRELRVVVDRELARCSAWYGLFPRSCSPVPGRHATFGECAARLPYVAEMGFDVLYLPPIHPIGRERRKGRNNTLPARPEDPGSPWAIGAAEGGHRAIHPELGTLEDFRAFLKEARTCGLEVAMDLAFQCAPDHPYVREHPEWFQRRPDGSVQYAENPPKRYEDIYPFHFDSRHAATLRRELIDVALFWASVGIRIFRVDNPHTKPFPFWEEQIQRIKQDYPETLFLSEAFTRPNVMYRLAKLGFTQSYTYFTWRNTKRELTEYMMELTRGPVREFFRPNLWPNTPDILPEFLQAGGRPAFVIRLALAATLGASYGIYGPAFELCRNEPREPGSKEYLNSEKYELRDWDIEDPGSLRHFIRRINRIRRLHPALQNDWSLRFHEIDNEQMIAYSKQDGANTIVVVVNLDPHHAQRGWLTLPPSEFGLEQGRPFEAQDLLGATRFLWQHPRNLVDLDPKVMPVHVLLIRRRLRTEKDFDYYL